ncbi:hypothetical protein PUN28_015733 [Cardiocondyla obscurior]|uniref:CHK kinase-like domain-containing protein n=1 Tax=Cardiocondyla obscurior TaxID=286306 RepID=A0AAW2EUG7_9HYME
MSEVEDCKRWLDEMMPKIIDSLGPNIDEARYERLEFNGIFIMSTVYRVRLQYINKANGKNEELLMILKRPMLRFNQVAYVHLQFRNEILFYETFSPDESFAKYLYAEERPPGDSIIALEDVNKRGYHTSYLYNPPLEYTLSAIRELGRFHGKGYAMKELQPEKFFDMVSRIEEVRYEKKELNIYEDYCNTMPLRAVEYLRDQNYDAAFCDKMIALLSKAFDNVMLKVVQPSEPLATLCHGDFTLTNILYKREDDGQLRAMLIDFGLIRYSSPVIDLSTYLFLCCSNETRRGNFTEIMRTYHDALKEYLLDAGVRDIEKYSYDALLDDFKINASYGFLIASCFLHLIFEYITPETLIQDVLDLGTLEGARKQKYLGGDTISKLLADMLLHLNELGCLKRYC